MTAVDCGNFFAVDPKRDCPHLDDHLVADAALYMIKNIDDPCLQCAHCQENWICLKCQDIFCSRYVNGHMVEHGATEQHHIVLSFSDLSFWCYACDSYIISPELEAIRNIFYDKKFGVGASVEVALSQLSLTGKEENKKEEEPAEEQPEEAKTEEAKTEENKNEEEPVSEKPDMVNEEAKKTWYEEAKAKLEEERIEEEKLYFDDRTLEELAERLKSGFFKNV